MNLLPGMRSFRKQHLRCSFTNPTPVILFQGCNNGGGDRFFSEVKRLVAKWTGTRKRLFSGFLTSGVMLQNPELFTMAHFTHKPIYTYLPLFMSFWIIQEHWDSGLFCSVTAEYVGFFRHFCVVCKSQRTYHFFYYT